MPEGPKTPKCSWGYISACIDHTAKYDLSNHIRILQQIQAMHVQLKCGNLHEKSTVKFFGLADLAEDWQNYKVASPNDQHPYQSFQHLCFKPFVFHCRLLLNDLSLDSLSMYSAIYTRPKKNLLACKNVS